jgi:hypothetical protein
MKERMGADQRQQRAEIAPLPHGNRQHKLGQFFGERNDGSALAGRQPLTRCGMYHVPAITQSGSPLRNLP